MSQLTKLYLSYAVLTILLTFMCMGFIGCSTIAERGKIVDGQYIPEEYIKVKGIGEAKFPEGYEIKGKPIIEMPQLPDLEIEK